MDLFHLFAGNEAISATVAIMAFYAAAAATFGALYLCGLLKDFQELPTNAQKAGRIVAIIAGFTLFFSGMGKVIGLAPMVAKFTQYNLLYLFKYTGVMEASIGLLVVYRHTYKLGVLFAIALCGGAIVTHLPTTADGFVWAIPSGSVMALLWISLFLYTPEAFPKWLTENKWVKRLTDF